LVLFKDELCHVSEGEGPAWKLQVNISGLLCETKGNCTAEEKWTLNTWWIYASSAVEVM
jgi:hypothetical protein